MNDDQQKRLKEVCHIPITEVDKGVWLSTTRHDVSKHEGFRVYYDQEIFGDGWIVTEDNQFRSPLTHSHARLAALVAYIVDDKWDEFWFGTRREGK